MKADQVFQLIRRAALILSAILAVLMGVIALIIAWGKLPAEVSQGDHQSVAITVGIGLVFALIFWSAGYIALSRKSIIFLLWVWVAAACIYLSGPLAGLYFRSNVGEKINMQRVAHILFADTPLMICLVGLLLAVLSKLGRANGQVAVTKE